MVSYHYGAGKKQRIRQMLLLIPLAWLLHYFSLEAVWWIFPLTEIAAVAVGILIAVLLDLSVSLTILLKCANVKHEYKVARKGIFTVVDKRYLHEKNH